MNKPRVVHIITRLEPGGSSRNTVDACAAQAREFDVTLLAGPHPESAQLRNMLPPEVTYIEVPDLQREICAARDLRALKELKAHLARLQPDIVHTHTSKAGALGRLAAALAGLHAARPAVVVHTPHGHLLYGYYGPVRTFLFKLAERFLAHFTDNFIALTPGEKRETAAAGIGRQDQWAVIHSGVTFGTPAPARREDLGISGEEVAIGTIARLEPVKGVEYFIRAAAELAESSPGIKARFVIIGGGQLENALKALAAKLGIGGQTLFTGFRPDAARLLGALDIYVQPSLNEAMGRAPLEAQALGLPAVVSSVCGLPDVVKDGETGFVVPPADAAALAVALGKLAADGGLRLKLGQAAREWALAKDATGFARFGPESMNSQLQKFYNKILAGRKGGIS
ncbi:MAG: glycosyltransferase [Elusimicrobiales bacterium]|nr:glycosyltransferase [Elusimicrobiales bacterium]